MTQTKGVDTLAPDLLGRVGALFGEFRTASESNSIPYSIPTPGPPHPLCHGLQTKDTESDEEEE